MADPDQKHVVLRSGIEHVLWCCRLIDDARKQLEAKGADAALTEEIRKCTDGIADVVKKAPELK